MNSTEVSRCCGGAFESSTYGPFGILVIADFCADKTRSSTASDVFKRVYGGKVPMLEDENYNMRASVDDSVVESFARGRTVITSRFYLTEAIYRAALLFLFNNASGVYVKATLKIW